LLSPLLTLFRRERGDKDTIRTRGLLNDDGDLAAPFRRLKLVLDYWYTLWSWPICGSSRLSSWEQRHPPWIKNKQAIVNSGDSRVGIDDSAEDREPLF